MKELPIANFRLPIEKGNRTLPNWQLAIGNWQ
jgi:hypothetical protein